MNRLWVVLMLGGIAVMLARDPSGTLPALIGAAEEAARLSFGLLGVYTVWLGILALVEACGLNRRLARALSPLLTLLFGRDLPPVARERISLNLSANLLGLGSAATPMGIAAMRSLDNGARAASDAMILLIVLNATSIQLLPTTLIGIRAAAGSAAPADIVLPGLIATTVSTVTGAALCKLCARLSRARAARRARRAAAPPA